ncbi:MAG: Methyltransferase type 11 [Parcubacteria group bacterium GW2011_GWB1_41_4]|nr:MAG: Methyltransferase type 11 [Parcubacteria group bacterium GW2011_GWB1_41_4]
MIKKPIKSSSGQYLLNLGCGSIFSSEWNNLDLYHSKDVVYHDLNRGIPYADNTFDAVYSSHVLEHFSREKGGFLIKEIFRVLKPGGLVRLVLPDLEGITKEYLKNLENYHKEPIEQNWQRYYWSLLELYDQTTRKVSGGEMLKTLRQGDVGWEYIASRVGDEFYDFKIGELHKWMYDSASLSYLLKSCGFADINKTDWNVSKITGWVKYSFDESRDKNKPRKPDSFYMEAKKLI